MRVFQLRMSRPSAKMTAGQKSAAEGRLAKLRRALGQNKNRLTKSGVSSVSGWKRERFFSRVPLPKNGFNKILSLGRGQRYKGKADRVILVWDINRLVPAELYRKTNFADKKTDFVVCEDPNFQKAQLGNRGIIYRFQ